MAIRFTKIKVAKSDKTETIKIRIEYEVKNASKNEWDEMVLTSSDEAKESFHEALQALSIDVVEMCELPEDYKERVIVRSVSFSYGGKNDTMGATITATMKLLRSNVPLNINTPHKIEEFYSDEGDEAQLLSEDCVHRLYELGYQAELFMKGERAQIPLFVETAASN